jgi:peptide/nickel transport system substrate-binding protein
MARVRAAARLRRVIRAASLAGLALVACLASPALAQKSADTLRISSRDAIPNLDPYHNPLRAGLVVAHQTFDGLVYRDPDSFTIKPLLAVSWKYVDDTTLEFVLRQGVKFHDGSAFSADDVVYTLNSIMTDPMVSVPSNYEWLAGTEKVDDTHVRVKLKRVFPAALEYIAIVLPILPKAYRERVGADNFDKSPVGAGPYRFSRVAGTTEIDLERFDDYYADSPKGKPAIRWLVIHEVPDAASELADLLGGRADWIWNFVADDFETITKVPTLVALRNESMRIGYLAMDAAGRSGAANPFTNPKVRQAVYYAIDRQAMAKNLMQGLSRVPEAPCYPTQFGCDAWAAVRYDYNPAKAKQLLAEAGYPDGFDAEIVSYVLPQYSGAVQGYLRAVGINTNVTTMQVAAAVQRITDGRATMSLGSFGSYSINDVSAILPYFFGGGSNDYARNPELEKLVEQGGASINPDERRRNYIQAIHLITEQGYWLPLHTYVTTYGFSRQLNFKPYPDEIPRFYLSNWK